ncbi:hypothetical protein EVAR_35981_1 [Eumeta japonica]|uniref:Uncharacterized protein n=1 Tax=Eumeta variegata TaxID=151549 RepID=A0A4C1WWI4_EUMVA|nr:hypothetical protein EVAR_35981_1 [Eumeta japonica]
MTDRYIVRRLRTRSDDFNIGPTDISPTVPSLSLFRLIATRRPLEPCYCPITYVHRRPLSQTNRSLIIAAVGLREGDEATHRRRYTLRPRVTTSGGSIRRRSRASKA